MNQLVCADFDEFQEAFYSAQGQFLLRPRKPDGAVDAQHQRILQSALALVHGGTDLPLHLADLCKVCNTSERTLRNLFTRHLGMSPHRYLMLHRLHVIRGAILKARPGETLTDICARHGVWDFGRFAGQYQRQFGELPSQSLRQRCLLPTDGRFADFT
ncbi:helix-turn-helix domain-containing protein [Pseudomonas sp. NPDC089554]|uniref:helix-turn-helix domain-containing protein n=1 Tax=Pseudomonas sp. NPDC089554 TaxID=3390653 RepID=UPI003D03C852